MFDKTLIINYVLGKVGLKQAVKPCYPKLNSILVNESDHRGVGSLLSPEFIYEAVDGFEKANNELVYQLFDISKTYAIGDRVLLQIGSEKYVFVSLQDGNLGNTPAFESLFWESDLSAYIRECIKNSTNKVITDLLIKLMNDNALREVIDFGTFYENSNWFDYQNLTTLQYDPLLSDAFVGTEIMLFGDRDAMLNLSSIGLFLDTSQTLDLYLYNISDQTLPIATIPITVSGGEINKFVWKELNLNLFRNDKALYPRSRYYLGFWLSDLQGKCYQIPARRKINNGHSNLSYRSFQVGYTKPNFKFGNIVSSTFNYEPFNFRFELKNDFTQSILSLGYSFLELIKHDLAIRILEDERISNRKNQNSDFAKHQIPYILLGEEPTFGLIHGYNQRIKKLNIEFSYKGSNSFVTNKFL